MTPRPLCAHAGPLLLGQPPEGRLRTCALGLYGGTVRRLVECAGCASHEPVAGAKPVAPEPVPEAKAAKRKSLPCVHEGAPARPPEGRTPARSYLTCEAGRGVVCRCGCNAKCPDYRADDAGQM